MVAANTREPDHAHQGILVKTAVIDVDKLSPLFPVGRVPRQFGGCSKVLLTAAAVECQNDWRRCEVEPNGAITVHNTQIW
jgi:hypothetical protein